MILFVLEVIKRAAHNTPMKLGYARVSTDEQNLDLQRDALKAAGCERIFEDRGVSGAVADRAGLNQVFQSLNTGDVLVVWKLDRLGRSLGFLCDLIIKLHEQGVGFHSITDGIDTTTSSGKLIFHIMGALAEFERDLIRERTKAGMKAAKKRGKHVGRPHALTASQLSHIHDLINAGRTQRETAELLGVSHTTVGRALKKWTNQGE